MSPSYQALYQKLRPARFSAVVGQPHVVRTLTNQLKAGRPNHAYLFCGTRGTGKTTCAKIFAKAINCTNPQDGEPCGVCESCAAIEQGRSVNAVEIDAASNNGVDNVRDIREELRFAPVEGAYKVYIIDEVHMLSAGAFNALLKTLEEPPAYVVFILATTDPQKIPATILSRCQRFDFRRVTPEETADALAGYVSEGLVDEGFAADADALSYIARAADGSMRDALSVLDRCAALFYGERLTADMVREALGATDSRVFFDLAGAVAARDCGGALAIIEEVFASGRDAALFASDFLLHLRDLLVILSAGGAPGIPPDRAPAFAEQAAGFTRAELLRLIDIFSDVSGRMRYAQSERLMLEIGCIKACNPPEAEAAAEPVKPARPAKPVKPAEPAKPVKPAKPAVIEEKAGQPNLEAVKKALDTAAASINASHRYYVKALRLVSAENNALVLAAQDEATAARAKEAADVLAASMKAQGFDQRIVITTEKERGSSGIQIPFTKSEEKDIISRVGDLMNFNIESS